MTKRRRGFESHRPLSGYCCEIEEERFRPQDGAAFVACERIAVEIRRCDRTDTTRLAGTSQQSTRGSRLAQSCVGDNLGL